MLSLPDTADRFTTCWCWIGADTNSFHHLGRRSTGTGRARWHLGLGWDGPPPAGADQVVRRPTRDLYLNLRVLVRDEADLAAHRGGTASGWCCPSGSAGLAVLRRRLGRAAAPAAARRRRGRLVDDQRGAGAQPAAGRPEGTARTLPRGRPDARRGPAASPTCPQALQARWRVQVPR